MKEKQQEDMHEESMESDFDEEQSEDSSVKKKQIAQSWMKSHQC